MNNSETIITTKLHLPFLRQKLVPRPRLEEQIGQGLHGPLTLVTAAAGFGKTTLITACLANSGKPAAWLSLDRDDNQVERFLNYLTAALQEADDAIGVDASQMLQAGGQATPDSILTSLVNDLDMAGTEITLVLDDYQFISNQAVHQAVNFLLEHCPPNFHLVIASRSDPPLPLARLRARGQVIELRAADLSFTEDEASQFLTDVMNLQLDTGSIAALEARTEGWIAGLQMAALSMRNREDIHGFIEGFSGTNRYILDFLLEEALANQPQEIQLFLRNTSILRRLSAPLCDAVMEENGESQNHGISHSTSTLEYLERENLFLIPLDDERICYRYHHLFADLLSARLQQAQPDLVPRLHIRASKWLEQNGQITEAIRHLISAAEIDAAADLIERYGPAKFAENDPSVVHMADQLPMEAILARPRIGLHLAWLLIIQGRIGEAVPLLNDLAKRISGAGQKSGQRWLQTVISLVQAFLNPLEEAPGFVPLPSTSLLDEIPPDEVILRDAADILYGMTLGRQGDLDRAAEVSEKGIERWKTVQRLHTIPTLVPFLTRIYLIQGRLHACNALSREFLDTIQERDMRFIYSAASMKIDLGEVLSEWNALNEAEVHIREGLAFNQTWRNIMTEGFGLVALTRLLLAKGENAEAMLAVDEFENRMREHSQPREFHEIFHTLRVRVQLAGGNLDSPSLWADQIQQSDIFNLHPERYQLTIARVRLEQQRYAEVEGLLSGFVPPIAAGSRISRQLESNLLLAAALAGQQKLLEAMEWVETCLALAEPEGYVRIFLDVGEPARDLLNAYLRSGSTRHEEYAKKLLDTFPPDSGPEPSGEPSSGLVEPLSERELEVLTLIAMGKTNKEIAGQLIIAPGTVKAHTASIYRKLDVVNRTEAAVRARELGILD